MKKIKALMLVMTALVMAMMFGVMVSAVEVPNKVAGLKQTDASNSSASIEWVSQVNCDYLVEISNDGINWLNVGTSYSNNDYIYDLTAGGSYYVRVKAVREEYVSGQGYVSEEGPYSEPFEIVCEPDKILDLKQTAATTSSVTFSWSAIPGADYYNVYSNVNGTEVLMGAVATPTAQIINISSSNFYVSIAPVARSASGFAAEGYDSTIYGSDIKLVPVKTTGLNVSSHVKSSGKTSFSWEENPEADGYHVQVFKGTKVTKDYDTASSGYGKSRYAHDIVKIKSKNKYTYSARVRAYSIVNGVKVYGEWSNSIDFNHAKVKLKFSGNKMTVSWNKVKSAKKYYVYMSTKKDKGYKKVASTKKTKVTISKFKKKALKKSKTYYVYVVVEKKVNGKKVKAKGLYTYYLL